MATSEQQQRILKARVALALYELLGRVPEGEEINRAFQVVRVMLRAKHVPHTGA